MSPTISLQISPRQLVLVGNPITIVCTVQDSDGDLNSFGVRWQGHGLISGSLPATGYSSQWIGTIIPTEPGMNYVRAEVWDNEGNGVTGAWEEINVTTRPAIAAAPQPGAVDINNLNPSAAGQSPMGPFAGTAQPPATQPNNGANTLKTIYTQNNPAAVTPPSEPTKMVGGSIWSHSSITVDDWLNYRPDLRNNWENANSPRFANDPLSREILKFGTLDNYARWTALMEGAPTTEAPIQSLNLWLDSHPDIRKNWTNAEKAAGSNDPVVASILAYGSLSNYARAAAQANPGAPAAGNQVATGTISESLSNGQRLPTGTTSPSSTSSAAPAAPATDNGELLKVAIPAAIAFLGLFK